MDLLSYYSTVIYLCWLALCVLCVLVRENDRIARADKHLFYTAYLCIAAAALAEWAGVQLSGVSGLPEWVLRCVKCADYVLTPMAGWTLIRQMKLKNVGITAFNALLITNTAFQVAAAFTGWMVAVDHGRYTHGPLYGVYMGVYVVAVILVVAEFIVYGRSFRHQNRGSLYAVMMLVMAGIAMQELLPGEHRTAYIALTMGAALLFIHFTEFSQLSADDHIAMQQRELDTDAMTKLYSRHAYSLALREYDAAPLPADLAAFAIDVNGLKAVNDTLGHEAGDELICGAADCIRRSLGALGHCYRTGGDEFVVLAHMDKALCDQALARLADTARTWRGKTVPELSLAAGCAHAADHPDLSAEKLVGEADKAMYEAKDAYYRETGKDRRSPR